MVSSAQPAAEDKDRKKKKTPGNTSMKKHVGPTWPLQRASFSLVLRILVDVLNCRNSKDRRQEAQGRQEAQ